MFSTFISCVVLSVCCRFIALDVSLLMFDRDMNWSVLFFSDVISCGLSDVVSYV